MMMAAFQNGRFFHIENKKHPVNGRLGNILVEGGLITQSPIDIEIPEELEELRKQHPGVTLHYAWPYNLKQVSKMLIEHIDQFS